MENFNLNVNYFPGLLCWTTLHLVDLNDLSDLYKRF